MDYKKKVSKNFVAGELCGYRSDNIPTGENMINSMQLVNQVLQPLRDKFGPVTVTSFFRNLEYNKQIGSTDKSQHTKGQAVDIQFKNADTEDVFVYILNNMEYDQVILEDSGNTKWIHISYNFCKNRNDALKAHKKNGKMIYERVVL